MAPFEGKLITFEGIDGSGKSTQANLLYEWLRRDGREAAIFREPGGTTLGENVRRLLLEKHEPMSPLAELMLFSAARAELVRQIVRPLLARNCTIILDRFTDSTTAYQGYGRGIDLALIESVNRAASHGIIPAATLLFDLPAGAALRRHARTHDRIEREGTIFMERVRQGYLAIAKDDPGRVLLLDAERTVESLSEEVRERVRLILA